MNMRIQDWSKLMDWERQKHYKQHVERIKSLSSPKAKKRRKNDLLRTDQSNPDFTQNKKHNKIEEMRSVSIQNQRLLKKLSEIGRRKSQFPNNKIEVQNYSTINMRNRAVTRLSKAEQLQRQNDLLVQRIVNMRSKGLLDVLGQFDPKPVRRSRKKQKSSSFALPKINNSNQDAQFPTINI